MMILHRADGHLDLERLSQTQVAWLGLGSLGSMIISLMPYPFAQLCLVDPEVLEIQNVERHHSGRSHLGQLKTHGVAEWLSNEQGLPLERIQCFENGFTFLRQYVGDMDLVIDATANGALNRFSLHACAERGTPLILASVYPKGKAGHIIVLPRPTEVCLACVEELLPREADSPSPDYGTDMADTPGQDQSWIPALRWPIMAIAARVADFALSIVAGNQEEQQLFIVTHALTPVA